MAIRLADIDLTEPLPYIGNIGEYSAMWLCIREKGIPIGYVRIPNSGDSITVEMLAEEIRRQCHRSIRKAACKSGCEPPISDEMPDDRSVSNTTNGSLLPYISVIVCTRFRPESLARTLDALLLMDYPHYEIIVVDNAPPNEATKELLEGYTDVRYLLEPRAGTNRARNTGISCANGEIVAFIDDDAVPDPRWLRGIAAGFADPSIGCVTGLILPAEMETPAQELFEMGYGGFGIGFRKIVLRIDTWKYAQYLPDIGQGCNMAFRKDLLYKFGLFDVVLDGGTPTRGGGEIDMFHLTLRAGYGIEYRPDALMFHNHRRDLRDLRSQVCGYSLAYTSLITKWFVTEPKCRLAILMFLCFWYKAWFLRRIKRKLFGQEATPIDLIALEAVYSLAGPSAYFKSLRNTRRLERAAGPTVGHQVIVNGGENGVQTKNTIQ